MGMDFNMAFAILNIEMTKDESLIRSAYRMALPANHPEDNPEGFQLLREAYEKALAYSRIFNHDPEPEDNTPIGVLRKKLAGIYQSISARTCYESWKELLWEDVFDDLDSYEEAKWELFTFLQGNYRIPREIYQLLNERFDVCENAQEFREKLSAAFVDYMVSNVSNENCGYSYEWFRMLDGRDDADYDSFLDYVQELEEALHNEDMTRAERLIRMIDAMGIRYPYYTLDKADYFIAIGKKEEAKAIALELADMETYRNDAPIQMRCGEVLWRVGEKQKAYVSLCQSLVLDDENYIGNKYAALYEMEHGELKYYSFNKKAFAIIVLKDVYVSAGLYEKAENLLRFYTYVEWIIEEGFYTYMTLSARHRLCTSYWKKKLLFWEVKKALRAYDRDDLRRLYADMLAYDFLMVKESVSVRQKMQRTLPVIVWDEHRDDLLDLIRLNKFLQKDDETARYKKVALDALQRRFGCGDLDIYDSCIDSSSAWRLDNLTYLVQLFSLTGEVALAEKYVVMMGECALCTDCNETICYDRFEAFGVFYEAKGDMQRAYEYYEKAVKSHGYYKGYAMLCMKRKYGKKWRKEGKTDLANNMC